MPIRLYTPFQIALASFFGTLLAGLLCLALNYKQLDQHKHYQLTLLLTLILVPLTIVFYIQIPDTTYDRLWPLVTAIIMWIVTHILQGNKIKTETEQGAERKSLLNLIGVIVASLLILLIILVLAMKLFGLELPFR